MGDFSAWGSLDPCPQCREFLRGHQIPSGKSGKAVQRPTHSLCKEASHGFSPEKLEAKVEGLEAVAWY